MNLAEAWTDIEQFLLEAAKAESEDALGELSAGGGDAAVAELELRLEREVPEEFKFYVREHPFETDYGRFYQDFELFSHEEIGFEKSEEWGGFSEAGSITSTPIVIGQDASIAFVTDLDNIACPVYRVDEIYNWIPELMASSLADFPYLLSYREMLYQRVAPLKNDDWQEGTANGQKLDIALAEKIEVVAPGCLRAWK